MTLFALLLAVFPMVAIGPSDLRLTMSFTPNARARSLSVEMDAEAFYRLTTVPVEGERGPNRAVVLWRDVPAGEYRIVARLLGSSDTLLESVTKQIIIR